jgi:hypothetical protein
MQRQRTPARRLALFCGRNWARGLKHLLGARASHFNGERRFLKTVATANLNNPWRILHSNQNCRSELKPSNFTSNSALYDSHNRLRGRHQKQLNYTYRKNGNTQIQFVRNTTYRKTLLYKYGKNRLRDDVAKV